MSQAVVRTQAELDAALSNGKVDWIDIRSERGVWLTVMAYGSARVMATDSARVTATGSATVMAYGSATVMATGSATVTAYGSATVTAYDSATVTAYGSATVTATGSATVTATGSATVTAYGSATVTAYDSATVRAYDSATVTAGSHVAVHLHSAHVTASGGVVIDVSKEITDAGEWCAYHGVTVSKADVATVYKAVDDRWTTFRGTDYSPGAKPSCDDWRDDDSCGGGLHFGPTPHHALAYHGEATRFVEVGIKVADLRVITGGTAKCKAPRVVRACREVTITGERVKA